MPVIKLNHYFFRMSCKDSNNEGIYKLVRLVIRKFISIYAYNQVIAKSQLIR